MLTAHDYFKQAPARIIKYSSLHSEHMWRYHNLKPRGTQLDVQA